MAINVLQILTMVLIGDAVSGDCGELPEISHSGNNMSGIHLYHEDVAAEFYCLPGYQPNGNAMYKCIDGEWRGGSFSCLIKKCHSLGSPVNGERIGDIYEVGSVIRFKCDTGYDLVGSDTFQCESDLKWQPPNIPECEIKKCPAAPSIGHGNVIVEHKGNGQNDVYGTVLKVQCLGNFIRNGPARMYCTKDGQWTKEPNCESVSCPPYPGLDSECVLKSKLEATNTLLLLYCTEHSTEKGTVAASCNNNEWDDLTLGCLCDCDVKANTELVRLENLNPNGLLKHGETLRWICKQGARKAVTGQLTCNDGSIGTPICAPDVTILPTAKLTNKTAQNKSEDKITIKSAGISIGIIALITIVTVVFVTLAIIVIVCVRRRRGRSPYDSKTIAVNYLEEIYINDGKNNSLNPAKGLDTTDVENTPLNHEAASHKGESNNIHDLQAGFKMDEYQT